MSRPYVRRKPVNHRVKTGQQVKLTIAEREALWNEIWNCVEHNTYSKDWYDSRRQERMCINASLHRV